MSHLVRECDVLNGEFQRTALQERQYAQGYLLADPESQDAIEVRKMIGDGAREYLEEQCVLSRPFLRVIAVLTPLPPDS